MCAVEWKKLGDVCEIKNGYTPSTKNSDFWIGGNIPWFTLEDIRKNGRILNDSIKHITSKGLKKGGLFPKDSIIISTTATIGEYALVTSDYICNQQITSISLKNTEKNNILIKYLYYLADDLGKWCLKNVNGGGSLLIISISKLNNYLIPLPPLAKQQEIVSQLDTFTTLISNLESELDMRRKQYEHYRNQLLDFEGVEGVEWKTLGEICEIGDGIHGTPKYNDKGYYYFINGNNLSKRHIIIKEDTNKIDDLMYEKYGIDFDETTIFMSINGTIGNIAFYNNEKILLGKSAAYFIIKDKKITTRIFLYYLLQSSYALNYYNNNLTGSTIKNLGLKALRSFKVPLPSLQEQASIVEKLDAFENLIQSLEQEIKLRKQQYEYYREKLLTFKYHG